VGVKIFVHHHTEALFEQVLECLGLIREVALVDAALEVDLMFGNLLPDQCRPLARGHGPTDQCRLTTQSFFYQREDNPSRSLLALLLPDHPLKQLPSLVSPTLVVGAALEETPKSAIENTVPLDPLFNRHGEVEHTESLTNNGSRRVFSVVTRSGHVVKATASQKLLTIDEAGWWGMEEAVRHHPGSSFDDQP
jgi:hypothetical protein